MKRKKRKGPRGGETSRLLAHPTYRGILNGIATLRFEWGRSERSSTARSSPTAAERALGLGKKWLSRIRRGEFRLGLPHLIAYIDLFGVGPSRFFRRAFPDQPSERVRDLEERLRGMAGAAHGRLLRRYVGGLVRDDDALAAGRKRLEALEELKKDDPRAAVRALRKLAAQTAATDSRLLGHALGMLAVTHHGLLREREAAACAALALELARATASPLLLSDALVRGSTLVADGGDYATAAELMLDALLAAEVAEDQDAVGRAIYRRALFVKRGGNAADALPLFLRSEKLKANDHGRFGALQAAGVAALELGDTALALDCLARAAALEVPRAGRGFAYWLLAETAASLARFEEAAAAYGEARSLLDLSHPADWVLVAIQQARALLRLGRAADAAETLAAAVPVAAVLGADGAAGAVAAELRAALREGATAEARLERLAARVRTASPLANRPTAD